MTDELNEVFFLSSLADRFEMFVSIAQKSQIFKKQELERIMERS